MQNVLNESASQLSAAKEEYQETLSKLESSEQLVANLSWKIDEKEKAFQRLRSEADDLVIQLAIFKERLSEQNEDLSNSKSECKKLQDEINLIQQSLLGKEQEFKEKQEASIRSERLAQKMLAKTHSDYGSLMRDFEQKAGSELEMIKLIEDLREKLEQASKYYFFLEQQHPELIQGDNEASLARRRIDEV